MRSGQFANILFGLLMNAAPIVLVPLACATIVGFIIALLQAVTQTQEQTLPQSVKILVIGAILIMFGAALVQPFFQSSVAIFDNFYVRG